MGITQQRLADMLISKRGKVAGYFYKTQARPEFHRGIGEFFQHIYVKMCVHHSIPPLWDFLAVDLSLKKILHSCFDLFKIY